jgi:hypothetical protein
MKTLANLVTSTKVLGVAVFHLTTELIHDQKVSVGAALRKVVVEVPK